MTECEMRNSKWHQNIDVVVSVIESKASSEGEALRVIYQMDVIREDFILVNGGVISNLDLGPIIQKHKYVKYFC